MKDRIIIEILDANHPAYVMGARYDVKLHIDGIYCGVGIFAKNTKEIEGFIKKYLKTEV